MNTSQKKLALYEIFVYRTSGRKMVQKLSVLTLKLSNVLKSRLCFKERRQITKENNPKTTRIKNAQFPRYCFHMSICVAQFAHLY